MKKNYIAPMSASIMVNPIVMSTGSPAADLTPSGSTEGGPACAPGRKLYI
ncbi:MAG: hypothetical protein MJZ65_02780 [Paludibacteraceae bacterium]|nr:hypothetical protein [Paludibacteraceae bacterium]